MQSMTGFKNIGGGASALTSHSNGFTLAEVLITLGIIGVVAAITIPTLVNKIQDKIIINKVKHGYSLMNNAIKLYQVKNNCETLSCLFDTSKTSKEVATELATVLKGAKVCTNSTGFDCKPYALKANKPSYKVDGKYVASDQLGWDGRIVLPNGIIYRIIQHSTCHHKEISQVRDENGFLTGETKEISYERCAIIYMDVNGWEGNNQAGMDVYRFDVHENDTLSPNIYLNNVLLHNKLDYVPFNIGDSAM